MSGSVDLTVSQLKTVRSLLERYLPGLAVWAYGSRVKWTSRPESDLDMVVFADTSYKMCVSALREAFEESNLPFRVDLFVWDEVPQKFRKTIEAEHIVIQEKEQRPQVIRSGWAKVKFGEVLLGGTRNGVYKKKDFHGSGTKIVNMGELFAYPRLHSVPMKRVELTKTELAKSSLQSGDLLFARRSLVAEGAGKCSIVMEVNEPTTFESSIIRGRPNPIKANSLFLYYMFSSPHGRYLLGTILRQVAVSGITGSDLVQLEIPLPPLPEQKTIAHILGSLDDKIELNRQMNQTLEAMAQAIFKSWFIDFDPVHAKAAGRDPGLPKEIADLFPDSFEDSELGEIPKGWKVSNIGTEFNLTMGQSPPGSTYNEEGKGLPFFQGRRDFGFRYPSKRVYCTAPTRLANANDTLVSVRAPVGDINMASEKCCVGRGVAAVRHYSGSRSYTYYVMRALGDDFARYEAEGTVFGAINKKGFENIKWIVPQSQVIDAFESKAYPLDEYIANNEHEMKTLATLRDTLLPKLISGELRVPDAEKLLEGLND